MDSPHGVDRADERVRKNSIFEALSHSTRRRLLRYLDATGGAMTVSKLGRELVSAEAAVPLDGLSQDHLQQTLVSLVHVHLPKLRAARLLEWDGDVVSLSDDAAVVPLSRPLDGGLLSESFTDDRKRV